MQAHAFTPPLRLGRPVTRWQCPLVRSELLSGASNSLIIGENTGNIAEIGPSSHAAPLKNQSIWDEIP